MIWIGWDGSEWEITDPSGGVFVPNEGVRGLSMPPVQRYTDESPVIAGSRNRGSRVAERDCFWPLLVVSDGGSSEWSARDAAFWKTMDPTKTGTWIFERPDGSRRYLDCRFSDDGGVTFERDPHHFGTAVYGITLIAEQPYWRGPRVIRIYGQADSSPFFGPETVTISPGSTISDGVINNPGDVPAYPIWTISGSFDTATVGIIDQPIEVPYAQASDRKLVIDTRPDRLTAYEYDVADDDLSGAFIDRTEDLGLAEFGSIPPGDEVALALNLEGPGINSFVKVELDPLHYRAW
jgi:hypothetical protein